MKQDEEDTKSCDVMIEFLSTNKIESKFEFLVSSRNSQSKTTNNKQVSYEEFTWLNQVRFFSYSVKKNSNQRNVITVCYIRSLLLFFLLA